MRATAPPAPGLRPFRGIAALLGIFALAMLIVFREPLASGFDLGFGNRADALIEISILEHWRSVFAGAAAWDSTGYFYPHGGTLGYNDGYFLYGLDYAFWRLFADTFLADTLNIAVFKTIGFFASWALVRRSLGWGRGAALFVALIFTIANNLMLQAVHAQLQSIALLPVAMMLAIAAVRAERDGRRRRGRALAVALAALMAAWLITAYYMAWFTIFFAAIFALCWCWTTGRWRPAALWGVARRHAAMLAWPAAIFAVLIIPFLHTYLPKAAETGGQGYRKTLSHLVTPVIDWVNVGPGNYLWGWLFRALSALALLVRPGDPGLFDRAFGGEHESGFPLILFVLVIGALWRLVRRNTPDGRPVAPELRALALAVLVGWALTVQLWLFSPWGLVFELVPGARGLRVVSRFQIFLVLPALLLVVAACRDRARLLAASRPWLMAGLIALLVAENLTADSPAQLGAAVQRRALWAVPGPPAGCRSFYVVVARRDEPVYRNAIENDLYPHNVDAMFLAERWRVPTINGFSTFMPPDWNFTRPLAADYDARAMAYAARHRLPGLCRLDVRQAMPWRRMTAG